jgi:hypothetical protein
MANDGFGSELWKNVQSIRFGKDGEIEAPARANGHDGIVVGVDHVAASDIAPHAVAPSESSPGRFGRWRARLTRR